jgi:hypothetical protein
MSEDRSIPPECYDRDQPVSVAAPLSEDQRYHYPEYIVRRRILTLFGSAIDILSSDGQLILFCRGKAFRIKQDMRVYSDASRSRELLNIRARQWLDFSAAYDVTDSSSGHIVGTLKRRGWHSLIQDKWDVNDPDANLIATIEEDSLILALLRRLLSSLIPQSYDIRNTAGELLAEGRQFFNPFMYKLRIIMRDDFARTKLDRRLILAASLLLATIEGRESG